MVNRDFVTSYGTKSAFESSFMYWGGIFFSSSIQVMKVQFDINVWEKKSENNWIVVAKIGI